MARTRQATHTGVSHKRGQSGKPTVVIDGVDAVVKDLRFDADTIRPAAGAVAVQAARMAAQRMKDRVPVASGKTRDSITADSEPTHDALTVYAEAGPTHFVARFLEYGTVKRAPRPFVGPAADEVTPIFERMLRALPRG